MTIRNRVILLIIISVVALVLSLYGAASSILLRGFSKLEQQSVGEHTERVSKALERELDAIAMNTADWAHWTEFWHYARGDTPDWYDSEAGLGTLASLEFNFMAAFDTTGKVLGTTALDLATGEEVPFPQDVLDYLQAHPHLLEHSSPQAIDKTLAVSGNSVFLMASAPIVRSDFTGDFAGTIMFGKFIDEAFVTYLQELMQFDIKFLRLDEPLGEDEQALKELQNGQAFSIYSESEDEIAGHTLLKDNHGQPLVMLVAEMPRPIYAQALSSRSQLTVIALLAMGLFSVAVYILFHQTIMRGFKRLIASVNSVANAQNAQARIRVEGRDEFAELGTNINSMLESLEHTQHKLQASEARYALAVTGVNDGLWEWDIVQDHMYFSARWMEILGYEAAEHHAASKFWSDHTHPDDLPRVLPELTKYLKHGGKFYEGEYRMRHQDSSYRWVLVRGVSERHEGRAVRMAGSLTDITKRGVFDPLTGLPHRQLMQEYLKHAHSYSQRHTDAPAAVLFLDLNRFKEINDSLGHAVGDTLLLEFSKRLRDVVRGEDKVARFGGDEFVVLMEGLSESAVLAVAERLSAVTSQVYDINGQQVYTSPSIGIVTNLQRYENISDIVRDADIAMYRSKAQKVPFVVFDDEMYRQVSERLKLETDLRQVLEKKELFVVYQPVVDLPSKEIMGFEALLRWQRQDRLVSPLEFIPIAEETGLIVPIGAWVLEQAAQQLKAWQEKFGRNDLYMTVNLSSRQLNQSDLVSAVQALLEKTGLKAQSLHLEITESMIIENQNAAVKTLEALRALGIRILMDDFGTGYSSLNYLTSLPIDCLKLDRSFSSQIENDTKTLEIVRTIINLAHSVQMNVVAEGIESLVQANLLDALGCELGQGYLFAKPQKPEAIETLLSTTHIPETIEAGVSTGL